MSRALLKGRMAHNSSRPVRSCGGAAEHPSPIAISICEHLFVPTKGGSYTRFRRALESGNLTLVRAAAAELPRVNLDDALRVCLLLRTADAAGYERAAIRWIGRFALEHPGATLAMLHQAVAAFERLPDDPEGARRELVALIRA
jgi:hypothetical protein